MMELTKTEVESMCDDLCIHYTSDCEFSSDEQRDRHIARIEHLRQMALRAAPGADEPVAWLIENGGDGITTRQKKVADAWRRSEFDVRELYFGAPPAGQGATAVAEPYGWHCTWGADDVQELLILNRPDDPDEMGDLRVARANNFPLIPLYLAPAHGERQSCQHEAYEGRCVHCNAPFVNGRALAAPAKQPEGGEIDAIRDSPSNQIFDIRRLDGQDADQLGVQRFTEAMLRKMGQKAEEGKGGWNYENECSIEFLWELLRDHVPKGDPVDIANFAMMLWNRAYPTGLPAAAVPEGKL